MNIKYIAFTLTLTLLAGCKNDNSAFTPVSNPQEAIGQEQSEAQPEPELVPVLRKAQPAKAASSAKQTAPKAQNQAKTQAAPYSKGEKIYVETYGAQGRVWGYVSMNGDRGTGTIHDWDENTWAVTVTRHGNELFAVDQNSRQYVFKLKEK